MGGDMSNTNKQSRYTTKVTRLGDKYGCRVFVDGRLVVEGRCERRCDIAPTFRDLLRTIDKLGCGDSFTHAARMRISKEGNSIFHVKHLWNRG
jgi:hypothetical protein